MNNLTELNKLMTDFSVNRLVDLTEQYQRTIECAAYGRLFTPEERIQKQNEQDIKEHGRIFST